MAAGLRTVVVSWGGSERLGPVIDAIERAGQPFAGEIVIVGRPDDAPLGAYRSRATVLAPEPGTPNTPGAHRNQGARGATAPWVLFADGDVTVEPGFVRDAVALLVARPEVAGVGGRIHERQWRGESLVREVPDLHKSGAGGEVEMLAAAWIARRTAFEAARGFDPRLPAEEDMELCVRLAAAGGRLVALDQRAGYHDCAPRPSWAEIRRRLAGGLFAGQGLLLRYSWGTPFFARHLWRQRLFLAALAYALLGGLLAVCAVVLAPARTAFALWALGALAVWALMALRKRSLALGGLAVVTWLALGIGIARAWIGGNAGTRGMRIQGVVDNNVWPPRMGVTARVWNLYRGLARRPEVSAVTVVSTLKSRERAPGREQREGVTIVRIKPWHPTLLAWLERVGVAPLSLVAEGHRRLPGLITRAFDPAADVLEVDSLNLTPLLAHARPGALKVYGAQNVEAEWFESVGPGVSRRAGWVKRLEALESEALAAADLVVAVSAEDRATFTLRYGTAPSKIVVIDNGFDADRLRMPASDEKRGARDALGLAPGERGLLFLGTDFAHNRLAVQDLFRWVVPELAALDARLFIVGGVSASFRGRARSEGQGRVRAVPEQADLTPYLWGADIGLNPITTGAGSNVKLPTYLAAGLDVVSTPFGVRGFDGLRPHVKIAEVDAFVDALRAPIPVAAGRAEALAAYAWQAQADRLLAVYQARLAAQAVPA